MILHQGLSLGLARRVLADRLRKSRGTRSPVSQICDEHFSRSQFAARRNAPDTQAFRRTRVVTRAGQSRVAARRAARTSALDPPAAVEKRERRLPPSLRLTARAVRRMPPNHASGGQWGTVVGAHARAGAKPCAGRSSRASGRGAGRGVSRASGHHAVHARQAHPRTAHEDCGGVPRTESDHGGHGPPARALSARAPSSGSACRRTTIWRRSSARAVATSSR